MKRKTFPLGALLLSLTVVIGIGVGAVNPPEPAVPLLVAALVGVVGVALGVARSRQERGNVDFFYPLLFPLIYVLVAFLAPAWYILVAGKSFSLVSPSALAPNTAVIMMVAVIGMALGLASRFKPPVGGPGMESDPKAQLYIGRLLLLFPLLRAGQYAVSDAILTRGVAQTTYGAATFIDTATEAMVPLALLLILNAHRSLLLEGLLSRVDWALVLGFVVLTGSTGERGQVVTAGICLLYAYTRRRPGIVVVVAVLAGILAFAAAMSSYRQVVRGGEGNEDALGSIMADLSAFVFTTGVTAREVPISRGYLWGETYAISLVRQLPSPIANWFLGPPYDTGTYVFRDIIGYSNPDSGLAFSTPAEGYLNFGTGGVFGACFLVGLFISWAYSRSSWPVLTGASLIFPVTMAVLPTALRSDALGSIKSVLYPFVLGSLILLLAAAIAGGVTPARRAPTESFLRRRDRLMLRLSSMPAAGRALQPQRRGRHSAKGPVNQDMLKWRPRRTAIWSPAVEELVKFLVSLIDSWAGGGAAQRWLFRWVVCKASERSHVMLEITSR